MMLYLFILIPSLLFSVIKFSDSSPYKDCQDPLLSNHDDLMYSITTSSTIYPKSNQRKLFEGWCGVDGDYVQVDFIIAVDITGVATRGYSNYWVKKYWMLYTTDGKSENYYKAPYDKSQYNTTTIPANRDAESYSIYWLSKKLRVRTLKLFTERENFSKNKVCWRFEILGCDGGFRNAVGLNQGRLGASFIKLKESIETHYIWNKTYLYKDIDESVGWCPLREFALPNAYMNLFFDGIFSLFGFAILTCPVRKCLPVQVLVWVSVKRNGGFLAADMAHTPDGRNVFRLKEGERKVTLWKWSLRSNEIIIGLLSGGCEGEECAYCMQLEFYGKQLECRHYLGVESSYLHPHGAVKNEQMTASSAHADHPAYYGRRQHFSAWCADPVTLEDPLSAKSQYLQIDFLVLKKIVAIATEGYHITNSFVKDFYLYYAIDESAFHSLRQRKGNKKMLLSGYTGQSKDPHYNWFHETPFVARYVRINPQNWNNNMCLRVEFLGCDAVTIPLGMEHGLLSKDQITASSEEAANRKNWGRLNSPGWCVSREVVSSVSPGKVLYHYFQIDLLEPYLICSVAIQGKETKNPEERPEAVTSFYLKYSFKGDEWFRYHTLLVGEYYGNSVIRYWLEPAVVTRFIQFNPQSSWSPQHVCMRVEIYRYILQGDVTAYLPLGMETFRISDAQLSASSEANDSHSAVCSRLNHHIHGGAWIPAKSNRSEFLQIDLAWIVVLTGIAIQGHPEKSYRTLAFKIRYGISSDEETFKDYPKEFDGNVQEGSTAFDLIEPTRCRYVRIIPLRWSEKVGLRAELYGFEADYCFNRLGVNSPSGSTLFNASSNANYSLPDYGHLHSGLGTGAWCAEVQDVNQYLQVDLKGETTITGVATQGQKYFDSWVMSFTLVYNQDGHTWNDFLGVHSQTKVFTGNEDRNTAVLHFFQVPLVARYLRFQPQKWRNKICMRVEIYGCAFKVAACRKCGSDATCIKDNNDDETCVCKQGYIGNETTCKDRDECSNSINPCPINRDCLNTVGSYKCKCKQGFVSNDSNCIDINECADANRCPHFTTCVNMPGSYTCDCGAGFAYNLKRRSCKDIDECRVGRFKCHPLASCVNTYGSYSCLCAKGYTGYGRVSCVDVNECYRDPSVCPSYTVCENTRGSYTCVCPAGYVWKGVKCEDVDECNEEMSPCPVDAHCVNSIGSYNCICKPGYIINGPYCIDNNECLSSSHNCDFNAWCSNTPGSYKCLCREGYSGNGFKCEKGVM